ncbi:MAG: hypothetical protein L0H73_17345 [Nitrococcus sp.]|nr:hypothetical protein [Nitrococcus sp.]
MPSSQQRQQVECRPTAGTQGSNKHIGIEYDPWSTHVGIVCNTFLCRKAYRRFAARSHYLPDRRDLNRAFPGSERGLLAARMAH